MNNAVTCIIPTRNRPEFMRRCLLFLRLQGCDHRILVADSSDDQTKGAIVAACAEAGLPGIQLVHFPYETGFYQKMAAAIRLVPTGYVYFLADDDFIFGDGVERCVEALKADQTLAAAAGTLYVYNQTRKAPTASLMPHPFTIYPQKNELFHDAVTRVSNHIANYSATFYSVYRTGPVKSAFNEVARRTDSLRAGEIFSSTYVLTLGRRKMIEHSLGLRVSHEDATHRIIPALSKEPELEELLRRCLTGIWALSGLNDDGAGTWQRWVQATRKYLLRASIPEERANRIADSLVFQGPDVSGSEPEEIIEGIDVEFDRSAACSLPAQFMEFGEKPVMLSIALCSAAPQGIPNDQSIPDFLDKLSRNFLTMPYAGIR